MTDHGSKVLARRTFRVKAWDLAGRAGLVRRAGREGRVRRGDGGVCAADRAPVAGAGSARRQRGMPFVCVQPAISAWVRKTEDLTSDKTDDKDAVLIARLVAQLRCYLPEPVDETPGPAAPPRHPPRTAHR